jgi:hypothetical protein
MSCKSAEAGCGYTGLRPGDESCCFGGSVVVCRLIDESRGTTRNSNCQLGGSRRLGPCGLVSVMTRFSGWYNTLQLTECVQRHKAVVPDMLVSGKKPILRMICYTIVA